MTTDRSTARSRLLREPAFWLGLLCMGGGLAMGVSAGMTGEWWLLAFAIPGAWQGGRGVAIPWLYLRDERTCHSVKPKSGPRSVERG